MADLSFIKSSAGLIPFDPDAQAWFEKTKMGAIVHGKMVVPVNGKFRRKFFVMLRCAYDNHDWPMIATQWGEAQTSFEVFREYVTIKAGHFVMDATPQGKPRAKAKSIKFAKMKDAEFEAVYSSVLDVILMEFLSNWKRGDMDNAVNQMLSFA